MEVGGSYFSMPAGWRRAYVLFGVQPIAEKIIHFKLDFYVIIGLNMYKNAEPFVLMFRHTNDISELEKYAESSLMDSGDTVKHIIYFTYSQFNTFHREIITRLLAIPTMEQVIDDETLTRKMENLRIIVYPSAFEEDGQIAIYRENPMQCRGLFGIYIDCSDTKEWVDLKPSADDARIFINNCEEIMDYLENLKQQQRTYEILMRKMYWICEKEFYKFYEFERKLVEPQQWIRGIINKSNSPEISLVRNSLLFQQMCCNYYCRALLAQYLEMEIIPSYLNRNPTMEEYIRDVQSPLFQSNDIPSKVEENHHKAGNEKATADEDSIMNI